jgi:hypothetical protein
MLCHFSYGHTDKEKIIRVSSVYDCTVEDVENA